MFFLWVSFFSLMTSRALFSSPLLLQLLGAFRCGTCLLVIGVQNPIHSLLLLIRVFFFGSLLLFTLQREYFGILFLIVYVGAIVVLFLFVIRRLELKRVNVARRFRDLFSIRHLVRGLLLLEVLFLRSYDAFDLTLFLSSDLSDSILLERNTYTDWSKLLHRTDSLRGLGGLLYTEYQTTLFLAALLLFLARVGAIAVTLVVFPTSNISPQSGFQVVYTRGQNQRVHSTRKRQDPNNQARRHPRFF